MPPGAMPGMPAPHLRKKKGRPSALTDELTEKFVKHMEGGAFFSMAAALEGIPGKTAAEWLIRGKKARNAGRADVKSEAVFARFSVAIEAAAAKFNVLALGAITKAGQKDWKALAFIVRARMPGLFSASQGVIVDTEERQLEDGTVEETTTVSVGGKPRNADLDPDLTDDDYAEAAAFLLRRKRLKQAAARGPGGPENA